MGKRILLVDDSALVRSLVRKLLEGAGWEVCGEATSGAEGIRKAEQLHPDLVVLDLAMPGINGLDAARVMREHPARGRAQPAHDGRSLHAFAG